MISIRVPRDNMHITIGEYIAYNTAHTEVERMMAATNLSRAQVNALKANTINEILREYEQAISRGGAKHMRIIDAHKMRLGFIPNFNAITLAEHIDLETHAQQMYQANEIVNYESIAHLFCILYRPITYEHAGRYEIQPYNIDKIDTYKEHVLNIPLACMQGALAFFLTILSDYAINTAESLATAVMTETQTEP